MTKHSFVDRFSSWSNAVASKTNIDWTEQLSILSNVEEMITSDLSLEEMIAAIYVNVNKLMDAFQFAVGVYDEKENKITYKGMIEEGKRIPDFTIDAMAANRLASWCIRHEKEIFINDIDREYGNYLEHKPIPITGCNPKAAMYVPLKLNHKLAGLITVRTIHQHAYQQHHLYILKTVGSFLVRTMALSEMENVPYVQSQGEGKKWKWNALEQLSVKSQNFLNLLTEREKDVLFLLVTGLQNKDIADRLFISPGTIKTHTLNLYQKLGVSNRTSAIVKALEMGWIL